MFLWVLLGSAPFLPGHQMYHLDSEENLNYSSAIYQLCDPWQHSLQQNIITTSWGCLEG